MNIKEIEEISRKIENAPAIMDRAMERALNSVVITLRNSAAKDVSDEMKLKLKLVRSRMKSVRVKKDKKPIDARLAFLSFDMPAIILGATQNRDGVKAGGRFYKGAFIRYSKRRVGDPRDLIFKRMRSAPYPLEEMRIPVQEAGERAFDLLDRDVAELFTQRLLNNIKFMAGLL